MNNTLSIFGMLLGATLFFNVAMNYMGDNIGEFENRPLPPKKPRTIETRNPTLKVDATSRDSWTLVDFSTGKTYSVKDADQDPKQLKSIDWDIGFQRTKIITNGGETQPGGGVAVANLGEVDFDSVTGITATGFQEDVRKWGNLSNPAIADWYIYRTRTHNVESKKSVFLVRTAEQGFMKMRILNYYCDHQDADCRTQMCSREEAACLTVEYVYLPPGQTQFPPPPEAPSVAAASIPAGS
jgi:hypothetical protein